MDILKAISHAGVLSELFRHAPLDKSEPGVGCFPVEIAMLLESQPEGLFLEHLESKAGYSLAASFESDKEHGLKRFLRQNAGVVVGTAFTPPPVTIDCVLAELRKEKGWFIWGHPKLLWELQGATGFVRRSGASSPSNGLSVERSIAGYARGVPFHRSSLASNGDGTATPIISHAEAVTLYVSDPQITWTTFTKDNCPEEAEPGNIGLHVTCDFLFRVDIPDDVIVLHGL